MPTLNRMHHAISVILVQIDFIVFLPKKSLAKSHYTYLNLICGVYIVLEIYISSNYKLQLKCACTHAKYFSINIKDLVVVAWPPSLIDSFNGRRAAILVVRS